MDSDLFAGLVVTGGIGIFLLTALFFGIRNYFKPKNIDLEKKVFSVLFKIFGGLILLALALSIITGKGCGGSYRNSHQYDFQD